MHNTQSLHNILKDIGIKTSFTNDIIITNNIFYKKFISKNENQIGGHKTINFTHDKKIYKIDHYEETDRYTYVLTPTTRDDGRSCFIIFIPKNEIIKYAYIENISSYQDCSHVGYLLQIILEFINSIKNKHELKYIQLQDNSSYLCKNIYANTRKYMVW